LIIGADPAMGLKSVLGIEVNKTIAQIREGIIKSAKSGEE
jgi:CO dehydrogenase nickel-insertion accessory protein CooC1